MVSFISNSAEETQAFAEDLGRQAAGGAVFGLVGELGAGKTQFVKGFARGLGVLEPILSPTFALLHSYLSGRLPLHHIDFYRLRGQAEILTAGLGEYFATDGVTVIEWWDRWEGKPPVRVQKVTFATTSGAGRKITYDPSCS